MELFHKSLAQSYTDIFEFFALEGNHQLIFKKCFLIAFNIAIPLSFLVQYVVEENVFISVDPLSQATDLIELFTPFMITSIVLVKFFTKRKTHEKMIKHMNTLDEILSSISVKKLEKIKKYSILIYTTKFLAIHTVGIGLDSFMMIS